MLPMLGWGGGTGDVTQTSPRGRVPTHPFPFSIPFLSSPLTHHPPPPPFFPQGGANPTGHVSHCCFARPGARRGRAVPPPRPTRNPPPAPSAPRSPGTVPRAGRSPYPALPCPALPRLARRWGCRAPFQRTPGYGGELHAASESSPSLGKSLQGSSPAARLPTTRAPARAAGTLPPRRGHAQARAARSRLEELPRAPRLQGSTSGMWDGMSIPRPRDEHPLVPAR